MGDGSWIQLESSTPQQTGKNNLKFDCAICGDSLQKPGPPMQFFSFGKLISTNQLSLADQELIYREFLLSDPLYKRGTYDCAKILSTECGHLFHSGCLREWFFMKRYDRTRYHDCRILHPVAVFERSSEDSSDDELPSAAEARKPLAVPMDYSDISCASSSYSSDESSEMDVDEPVPTINSTSPNTNNIYANIRNNNEIIYELHPVVPQIDIAGDTTYSPEEYLDQSEANRVHFRPYAYISFGVEYILRVAVSTYDNYNIAYVCLLAWVFSLITRCYEGRMKEHVKNMDDADDEALVEANSPISLGYPFTLQVLLVGFIIWLHERFMNNLRKFL
ncbi:unnamed protein product [Orchesella dallaii]|uniref:RING-type domain-containing protein n=1 Tax=Orchesella dallaii TaxID=48710 RepID=A0ABP1Q8C8_9HEXA